MKYALVILLTFGAFLLHAQKILIPGKVVDAETKEPLSFASIGLKGKPIGTITNLQGEFDFHLPIEMRNDFLMVNMLGYKTFEAPVWSLLNRSSDQSILIELAKSPVILRGITVKDSLRAGDILQIAIHRIEKNFPMKPFLMNGFYREIKKLGGTYISLLEAAVQIFDEDYIEPRNKIRLRERVALNEMRQSLGYENRFTSFFNRNNLLEDLLLNNNVRYRQFPEGARFFETLQREKDSFYHGKEIFVVSHRGDYYLKIYIEKKSYGIVHLEYENKQVQDLEKRRDLESKLVKVSRMIDFKYIENKLYLNYIQVTSQINWYESKSGKLKFETELQRELLINNVQSNSQNRIPISKKMKSYGLQFQDRAYNKEFWESYNVIKETPLNKKVVQDLERKLPLENQFKENK